jgi:hypothetical protein
MHIVVAGIREIVGRSLGELAEARVPMIRIKSMTGTSLSSLSVEQ